MLFNAVNGNGNLRITIFAPFTDASVPDAVARKKTGLRHHAARS